LSAHEDAGRARATQLQLRSEATAQSRADSDEYAAPEIGADALFLFPPENPTQRPACAQGVAGAVNMSRWISAVEALTSVDGVGAPMGAPRPCLLGNEIAERTYGDAEALRNDLSQLREASEQLAAEHTKIAAACRKTEERNGRAAVAISEIEKALCDVAITLDDKLAEMTQLAENATLHANALEADRQSTGPTLVEARRQADQHVASLEQRVAETDNLERRLSDFDAQKAGIERALIEATRITDVLSELENRIFNLTETDQLLDRAGNYVRRLEARAADAIAQIEQAGHTKSQPEQELDARQKPLRRRGRQTWWSSLPRRGALVGGLGAAVLLVVMTMRFPHRTGPNDSALASTPREPGRAASEPVLVSRRLPVPLFGVPASPPRRSLARNPRSNRIVVRRSAPVPTQAGQSDSVRGSAPALKVASKSPSREKGSAQAPVEGRQFTGALAIDSEPAAAVFVNQQPVGETPIHLTGLRAGSHLVWIVRDGYERWTRAVLVSADKETRVTATLQLNRGQ